MSVRGGFDIKLEHLNNDLIRMGGLIEEAIANSLRALRDGDRSLAKLVVKNDDIIDEMEKDIESQSLSLILREQPVADDLRRVSSALKMVTDMERIGDSAADIAEISLSNDLTRIFGLVDGIQEMAEKAILMVADAVTSFVKLDTALAENVMERDDEIDALFDRIKYDLVEKIKKDDTIFDMAVDIIMIIKYLERIGDHSVNICEWVCFCKTGEYKHTKII
jgi:phosphate transport system protein